MDIHENARTTPHSRAEMVRRVIEEGASRSAVAKAFSVCCKTVSKWVDRFLAQGPEGLRERSSRPHRLYRPTPGTIVETVIKLRRQRLPGRLCDRVACSGQMRQHRGFAAAGRTGKNVKGWQSVLPGRYDMDLKSPCLPRLMAAGQCCPTALGKSARIAAYDAVNPVLTRPDDGWSE